MLEIVRALANAGHRVTVHSFTLDEDVKGLPEVRWRSIPVIRGPQLLIDIWMIFASTLRMRKSQHDVACILGPCAFVRGRSVFMAAFSNHAWRSAWKRAGLKQDLYRRVYGAIHTRLELAALARASGLVAMSPMTADELRGHLRAGAGVCVSPGGVDADEFKPAGPEDRLRAKSGLGIPGDRFVISIIGEFATGRKGVELFARGIALRDRDDEVLVVLGSGPRERMTQQLRHFGVQDRSILLSPRPSQEVLAATDLVAIPSVYEPFSLVALEAAASALPVVLSEKVGAGAYMSEEGAATTFDPFDPGAIAKAIDEVRVPGSLEEMGEAGLRVARSMDWSSVSAHAVRFIEGLAPS